ncbi:hypothetical protein [Noviherbaspirillum sp.]|uniref:hypothetical protein n=1 Tax=Noviherbaspirillum sp. TaxID=1926288 RepID=UPI002D55C81F|nr:hypothetical protein [Noviherbaspirillum sp.]HZW23267.1 hypothetical protein [Noviherbaspirillum sp.]
MPDASFAIPLILQSALVPFGVALVLLFALRRPALAIAAGFVAAYFSAFHAQWAPVPKTAMDWLPYMAVFGAAVAPARLLSRFAVSLVALALVVWPALASLGMAKALMLAATGAVLITAAWTLLATTGEDRPTPAPLLAIVAGGAGLALMLDSSAALGQSSLALASALAACALFNLPRVRVAFPAAATGTGVLLLGVLLANAYLYAGFSPLYLALLGGALAADPLVASIDRLRGAGSWITAAVLTAVPVLATVGLAVKTMQESGGY